MTKHKNVHINIHTHLWMIYGNNITRNISMHDSLYEEIGNVGQWIRQELNDKT